MALLIRKTDNLRKSDGSEIIVNQEDPNDGILIRFMPQGQFKGFAQTFFLQFYTKLQFDQEGFGTIQVVKLQEETIIIEGDEPIEETIIKRIDLINKVVVDKTFAELMADYDAIAQAMPQMHPLLIFAYGYHLYIKQALEEIIGEDTIEIRLDLM
jgi:hypothetical protein